MPRPSPLPDEPAPPDDPKLIEIRFTVPPDRDGWRLDRFLSHKMRRLSRTRIQRIIEEEVRTPDGRQLKPSHTVRVGEKVLMSRPLPAEPEVPLSFAVLYEDDELLAIDKPAGLPVHPTARYHRGTLTWLLRQRYPARRPVVAHRLDRETSGVLLCAKTPEAERSLKGQFEARTVAKTYLAIVQGVVRQDEIVIDLPLGPAVGSRVRIRMAPRPGGGGLESVTEVRVLERLAGCTLVSARPRTGRQHQIRAHLSAAGHPVVGDKLYGDDEALFIEFTERGLTPELLSRLTLPRHALHAHAIEFDHPGSSVRVGVTSPLPADMASYLAERRSPAAPPGTGSLTSGRPRK